MRTSHSFFKISQRTGHTGARHGMFPAPEESKAGRSPGANLNRLESTCQAFKVLRSTDLNSQSQIYCHWLFLYLYIINIISIYLSTYLSIHLSIHPSIHPSNILMLELPISEWASKQMPPKFDNFCISRRCHILVPFVFDGGSPRVQFEAYIFDGVNILSGPKTSMACRALMRDLANKQET